MGSKNDRISDESLRTILASSEPLETKEIEALLKKKLRDITRTKLFFRLHLLRGEGRIYGKSIGSGKGVWVWWAKRDAGMQKGRRSSSKGD